MENGIILNCTLPRRRQTIFFITLLLIFMPYLNRFIIFYYYYFPLGYALFACEKICEMSLQIVQKTHRVAVKCPDRRYENSTPHRK